MVADGPRQRFQHIVFPEGVRYSVTNGFLNPKTARIFALVDAFDASRSSEVPLSGLGLNQIVEEARAFAELAPLLDLDGSQGRISVR